jgi:hypothetical protein
MKERSKGREEEEKSSELLRTAYKVTPASETYSKELVHYGQVVRGLGIEDRGGLTLPLSPPHAGKRMF